MMSLALETPLPGAASVPVPPPPQSVTLRGPGGRSLTAWAPRAMTIRRGESAGLVSDHSVGVTVEGPDGCQATQFVNITVAR